MILKNEYHITLDIKRNIAMASQTPIFVANDSATLFINVVENGKPYDFSSADRYVASFRRPDGVVVNGLGTLDTDTGLIKYELGSTEMAVHGNVECSIQMFLGDTRVSTRPFNIKILKDYEGGIGSQQDLTLLQELFIEVDQVKTDVIAAGDYATAQGDYAKGIRANFGHKGEYDNTKTYKDGNVVSYGGINYMCILETTAGINPLNGTYWVVVSPQATINEQTWTATEGQRTFTLTNGKYVVGKGNIEVVVGGVRQLKDQGYGESSETTITLTEGVPAGTIVYAKWFEGHMYIAKGHQSSHLLGGQDEIDVTQLRNFKEQVTDKFTDVTTQLAERPTQTDLTNAVSSKADKTYVDTELGKKASTSYVDTKTASIASGSPKGTYATITDLTNAFPSGNTNIYVVTANGNWYYWSGTTWTAGGVYQSTGIADKTVTEVKTSFITTGKNLFNKSSAQVGYYIYDVDGKVYANASYSASDYVEVEPSTAYTRNIGTTASRYAWYDSGKTFISGGVTGATITSPANAKYIRFSVDNTILNTYQFEKGSAATPYESFYYKLASVKATPEKGSVSNESLADKSVSASKTDFVISGKNKFDKSKVTAGYYVNNANGVLQANANYAASDFIEVEPDTDYVDNSGGYYLAFYDANKAYISGLGLAHNKTYRTPVNAKYIRLSVPNNLVSSMQFEKGTVSTEYQAFGYVLQNGLYQVASNATSFKVELNLPSKIYGLVGQELNIYFDNIVNVKDVNYDFDVVADVGDHFEQYFRFTPTAAGSFPITVKVLQNGSEIATASSTIIVKASSVGTGINKKLILIGDSTTNNGYPSIKLNENFNADPMDITLVGTRGTAPDLHEGRSGWKAKDYMESASLSGVTNAFWNPNTSAFDFSYYITNNGFSIPDYVVINLGINDTFNYLDDASLNTEMTNIISRYDQMISSIKAYNANIKIGIALTIPPNYSQDAFGKAYDAGQTRARYKRNNFLWVQKLIATYQNREAENLYLVPIHLNIDTRFGYGLESTQVNARNTMTVQMPVANGGVHPGVSGYWQIADTYWYWLKSFES